MDARSILALTVPLLKEKLIELGLSTDGRKSTLQDRLLDHFQVPDTVDVDDVDNTSQVGSQSTEFQDAVNFTSSRLTLRDVQDSISSFSGSDQQDINHWLIEFEDVAVTVGWDNLAGKIHLRKTTFKRSS